MLITITSKRQATFPKKLLEALGVDMGDKIMAKITNGRVTLEPVKGDILDLYGFLEKESKGVSLEKIMEETKKARARAIAREGTE